MQAQVKFRVRRPPAVVTRTLLVIVLFASAAACGNRLPQAEIEAAAGGRFLGGGEGAGTAGAGGAVAGADGVAKAGEEQVGPDSGQAANAASEVVPGQRARNSTATGPKLGKPVVLGHVGNYSGIAGQASADAREVAQVWSASVNARGGLNGSPVRLITANDDANPSRHVSLVREMVEKEGAIAFVGNMAPLTTAASVDYLTSRGVPVVGGEVNHAIWHREQILFPHVMGPLDLVVAGAHMGVRSPRGGRRIGLIYCAEVPDQCGTVVRNALAEGGARRAGGEFVWSAEASLTQPNYTSECLGARNNDVETLYLAMTSGGIRAVKRDCAAQGFRPQIVGPAWGVGDLSDKGEAIDEFRGVARAFPWMANGHRAVDEFRAAMKRFAPRVRPGAAPAKVWLAGKLLEQAVRNSGGRPTSDSVRAGLWQMRGETLGGLSSGITFFRGKPAPRIQCYYVVEGVNGEWTAPNGMKRSCLPQPR